MILQRVDPLKRDSKMEVKPEIPAEAQEPTSPETEKESSLRLYLRLVNCPQHSPITDLYHTRDRKTS